MAKSNGCWSRSGNFRRTALLLCYSAATIAQRLPDRDTCSRLSATDAPVAFHEWEAGVGHAVLHLGAQVHAALPIQSGERRNLVIWMRSTSHRKVAGCPMCDRNDRLL